MASKKYAYYNKGNKVAIVQQDVADVSSLSYGQYKSPNSYVEKGIEIEYSYAPIYRNGSTGLLDTDKFARFQCWGALDGCLTLFASGSNANDFAQVDLTSKFAVGDWIEIQGSGRWSGIHKVKSRTADGTLQLETSIGVDNLPMVSCTANIGSGPVIFEGNAAGDIASINSFKASVESMNLQNVYIWADDTTMDGTVENLGLYTASPLSEWGTGQVKTSERHFSNAGVDVVSSPSIGDPEVGDAIRLFIVFREKMTIYKGIEVLEDESFDLDLDRYQSQALIYFVRSRMAEDAGDLERHEYYLTKFRHALGKFRKSKKYGAYMIQGNRNMLK